MIASLRMYEWPEMRRSLNKYWQLIKYELLESGLSAPESLDLMLNEKDAWMHPNLVLGQTCGMPYRKFLYNKVSLIGTPNFGIMGCPAGYYNSVFITNIQDNRSDLIEFKNSVFAYNMENSQSGLAAAFDHTQKIGFWFSNRLISGGHTKSSKLVANGQAAIACLDSVSWRLLQRYSLIGEKLKVIAETKPSPGLPYISAIGYNSKIHFYAIKRAIKNLDMIDKKVLGIIDLEWISKDTYLEVSNPPSSATYGD